MQHREVQGFESQRFLSYFPKGIRIQEGGHDSGFNHVKPEKYPFSHSLSLTSRTSPLLIYFSLALPSPPFFPSSSLWSSLIPPTYRTRLLHVKGKKYVRVTEVPLSYASLNSGDVFIVDSGAELIQFNGSKSGASERNKAAQFLQAMEGNYSSPSSLSSPASRFSLPLPSSIFPLPSPLSPLPSLLSPLPLPSPSPD